LLISKLAENKPQELVILSTIRAKFSELLAKPFGLDPDNAYYMGLFSLIDSILGTKLEKILKEINYLDEEIKKALLGKRNNYRELLDFIILYENGDFDSAEAAILKYGLNSKNINALYMEAIDFADSVYSL